MQAPVEICYAGVVIASTEEVREGEGGEFFVGMKDPFPVGTLLHLRSADSLVPVRVLRVVEASDGAGSGMQVRPARSDEAGAALWIPPPPAAKPASTPSAAAKPAPTAVAPSASDEPAPAAAVPAPAAAAESASEIPVAVSIEEPVPAGGSVPAAIEPEVPAAAESAAEPDPVPALAADQAPVGKEEQPIAAEAAPPEFAAPDRSPESAVVPEAVPAAVGSSLTGALKRAAAGQPDADSGAVAASVESPGSGDAAAPIEGDLPPARPVQGSGGRRRTKRRR